MVVAPTWHQRRWPGVVVTWVVARCRRCRAVVDRDVGVALRCCWGGGDATTPSSCRHRCGLGSGAAAMAILREDPARPAGTYPFPRVCAQRV